MEQPPQNEPPQNPPSLFVDAVICGAIGGGIALLLGRPMYLWALLCTMVGPIFIMLAERVVAAMPPTLPGKHSGTYEFAAFAVCVAILVGLAPFSR